jgi:hypothetical protein
MDPPKRRLPVLNSPSAEAEETAGRRPWQWVGFGALAIFTAWIPLAALAGVAASRLAPAEGHASAVAAVAIVGVYAVALALGAGLGGFLVGRWGSADVGSREAALAGLGAAGVAAGVTWVSFGPSLGSLLLAAIAAPAAALGGRLGARARARAR